MDEEAHTAKKPRTESGTPDPKSFLAQFAYQASNPRIQKPSTSQKRAAESHAPITVGKQSVDPGHAARRNSSVVPASAETIDKWTAFCNPRSTREVQRYQVFVAIQLSTQAYPAVVKQALKGVEDAVGGEITPQTIRELGYERLKGLAEKVHRNKQKAKRVVDAAELLKRRYNDIVPRTRKLLQKDFLGIGDQLGELLESLYAADWSIPASTSPSEGPASRNPIEVGAATSKESGSPSTSPPPHPIERDEAQTRESTVEENDNHDRVTCPVCTRLVLTSFLNAHLDTHFDSNASKK